MFIPWNIHTMHAVTVDETKNKAIKTYSMIRV